jgi:TrmH family RNA methyltransferase
VLLDGEHLVEEALDAGIRLDTVAFAERIVDSRADGLVARVERAGAQTVRVPDQVLNAISPARQPSGVVALARHGPTTLEHVLGRGEHGKSSHGQHGKSSHGQHGKSSHGQHGVHGSSALILVLAGIQDAGNVGAIVRAADGCGASGVITIEGTADPFGWKALRGAMGSTFRVPIAVKQRAAEAVAEIKRAGLAIIATVPREGTPLADCDLTRPAAIVLGAEGSGLSGDLIAAADERVTIPMRPPVESLNVAITAALMLYEASQQRTHPRHVAVR